MAEERRETREEEVARVRSYLVSQATRRPPAQLVEALKLAHQQLLEAVASVPEERDREVPREGEWSLLDVLLHMRTMAAFDVFALRAVLERGELPPTLRDAIDAAPQEANRRQLLDEMQRLREQLYSLALAADPQARLDLTWGHSEFGKMNWREWLLFARVHTLDHMRQIQAIAGAL